MLSLSPEQYRPRMAADAGGALIGVLSPKWNELLKSQRAKETYQHWELLLAFHLQAWQQS